MSKPNCLGSILHFVFRAWAQGHLLVITVCSHDDGRNAHRDCRYADSWREPVASRLPRTADWHSSGLGYDHDFDFLPHFASVLGANDHLRSAGLASVHLRFPSSRRFDFPGFGRIQEKRDGHEVLQDHCIGCARSTSLKMECAYRYARLVGCEDAVLGGSQYEDPWVEKYEQ
jgi:hypothetical protein